MKKFKTTILSVALVAIGFVIGCIPTITDAAKSYLLSIEKEYNGSILDTYILTDSETKIQYIVVYDARGTGIAMTITPRIAYADGTLYKKR